MNPNDPSSALLGVLQDITGMFDRQRQDENTPSPEITTKRTPEGTFHTVDNLSDVDMKKIMDVLNSQAQIVDAYQKEIGRLDQQQKSMNPILNVLATVGGNLAMADKRLPPVVQALGASARQLNPTKDELTDRKLGLMRDVAGIQGQEAGLLERAMDRRENRQIRQDQLEETKKRDAETVKRDKMVDDAKVEAREDARSKAALTHFDTQLRISHGKTEPFEDFAAGMKARGVTNDEKVKNLYEDYKSAGVTYAEAYKEQEEAKAEARRNSPAALLRSEEKAEDQETAQNLVKSLKAGDPVDLAQIVGMRSNRRERVFNMVEKLDPTYSVQKVKRMVNMEQDAVSGKPGTIGNNIQSFDTFMQHAGALQTAFSKLKASDLPILNKSWQWIQENTGKPEVARVRAALDPVHKEFESFLLNNRALYAVDRETVEAIIHRTMSPAGEFAAVNQMGHTVEARFKAINNRYKQTMDRDIVDRHPFTPEAVEGAKSIGVTLPVGADNAVYDWVDGHLVKR